MSKSIKPCNCSISTNNNGNATSCSLIEIRSSLLSHLSSLPSFSTTLFFSSVTLPNQNPQQSSSQQNKKIVNLKNCWFRIPQLLLLFKKKNYFPRIRKPTSI
mmetsp:Transcript_50348/g.64537  ORF Transcript_50348/g.64537 Transcript_50348/m.64537 type:complete len:102 (+) Transcript_50348:2217-2522(+)